MWSTGLARRDSFDDAHRTPFRLPYGCAVTENRSFYIRNVGTAVHLYIEPFHINAQQMLPALPVFSSDEWHLMAMFTYCFTLYARSAATCMCRVLFWQTFWPKCLGRPIFIAVLLWQYAYANLHKNHWYEEAPKIRWSRQETGRNKHGGLPSHGRVFSTCRKIGWAWWNDRRTARSTWRQSTCWPWSTKRPSCSVAGTVQTRYTACATAPWIGPTCTVLTTRHAVNTTQHQMGAPLTHFRFKRLWRFMYRLQHGLQLIMRV